MKAETKFIIGYFFVLALVITVFVFEVYTQQNGKTKAAILCGGLIYVVGNAIVSILIEKLVLLFQKKYRLVLRFALALLILEAVCGYFVNFHPILGLFRPVHDLILSLVVVGFYLIPYIIVSLIVWRNQRWTIKQQYDTSPF